MAEDRISDAELHELRQRWEREFDESVSRLSCAPEELHGLAESHRRLARVSDSVVQRWVFDETAERYEREAATRAAIRP